MSGLIRQFPFSEKIIGYEDTHSGKCGHALLCCDHDVIGTVVEGSSNVFCENRPVVMLKNKVKHTCVHCGDTDKAGYVDICRTNLVYCNDIKVAQVGDHVIYSGGEGELDKGSSTVFIK